MSRDFQWRTDEEEGWENPLPGEDRGEQARTSRRRRWWAAAALFPILLFVGLLSFRQYEQRLAALERDVATDLLAGAETVQRAVATGDVELLRLNLSGRDPDWTAAQESLLQASLFFDRSAFGLEWTGAMEPTAAASVIMAPDLRSGEVPVLLTYRTTEPSLPATIVQLHQDQVFRLADDQRWLYAPALDAFWGAWTVVEVGAVQITVSNRDLELVQRLADDLSPAIAELCAALPDCAPLDIRMARDPASLLDLAGNPWILSTGGPRTEVVLPTPSLVGIPVNEAGYAALRRGYSRQLLGAIYAHALGLRCCRNGLLLQALVDHDLATRGWATWPMTPEAYQRLLVAWRNPDQLAELLGAPSDAGLRGQLWPAAYALIEFGLSRHSESARIGLLEKLPNLVTFSGLLRYLMPLDDRQRPLEWAAFLDDRQSGIGVAWPKGYEASLVCRSEDSYLDVQILGFAPGTNPRDIGIVDGSATLYSFGEESEFLVQRIVGTGAEPAPILSYWRDGDEQFLGAYRSSGAVSASMVDSRQPAHNIVPVWLARTATEGDPRSRFGLLDVNTCRIGTCRLEELDGYPVVAPDRRHVLSIRFDGLELENVMVSATDAPRETLASRSSRWAFWVTGERFATIDWDNEVHLVDLAAPEKATLLVTANTLIAGLPESVRPPSGRAEILDGFSNPADSNQYYFYLMPDRGFSSRALSLLVRFDVGSGQVTFIDVPQATGPPQFSADGRWLVFGSSRQGMGSADDRLVLLDTTRPTNPPRELAGAGFAAAEWLPDDNLLLVNHGTFMRLFDPDGGQITLVSLPAGRRCPQALWRATESGN